MPRFLFDENLSPTLPSFLQSLGYDAKHVREVGLKGRVDTDVVKWAKIHKHIVVTRDLGFGLVYSQTENPPGILLLRSKDDSIEAFQEILERLHKEGALKAEKIKLKLTVATKTKTRQFP